MVTAEQLIEFVVSLNCPFLKDWKARGMIQTLTDLPGILHEKGRCRKYVANCLEMEGFNEADIDSITAFLLENK